MESSFEAARFDRASDALFVGVRNSGIAVSPVHYSTHFRVSEDSSEQESPCLLAHYVRGYLICVLGFLLRNLVLSRRPLSSSSLGAWARTGVPGLMGLEADHLTCLNDDRVGRALDRLFDVDRQALLTDLVGAMVREFEVRLDALHNDSTTITLQGT